MADKKLNLTNTDDKKDRPIVALKPVANTTGKMLKGITGYMEKMSRTYTVNYVTGLTTIKKPTKNYQLVTDSEGIHLSRFLSPKVFLSWQQITKISSESQGSMTRSPSMGKAAVGLLLLGPFGALAGASMGNKHDDRVNYISVIYKNELGEDTTLVFQSNKAHEIANKLNEERIASLKDAGPRLEEKKAETGDSNYLRELEKLAELKDKGVISKKEFDAKKKQLLG